MDVSSTSTDPGGRRGTAAASPGLGRSQPVGATCWWWPLDEMEDLPVEVVVFDLLVVLEDPAAINEPLQVSLNVHLRGNLLLQVFNGALVVHVFYGVIGRVQGLDRHLDGGHDLNVSNAFGKFLTFSIRVDSLFYFF